MHFSTIQQHRKRSTSLIQYLRKLMNTNVGSVSGPSVILARSAPNPFGLH